VHGSLTTRCVKCPFFSIAPPPPQYTPSHYTVYAPPTLSTPAHYLRPPHLIHPLNHALSIAPSTHTSLVRPLTIFLLSFFVIGAYSLLQTLYAPPYYTAIPIRLFLTVYALLIFSVICYISGYPFQYEDLLREHTSFKIQLERCELELDLKERSLTDLRTALRESEERSRKIAQFVERQTEQIQHLEMTAKQAEQVSLFLMLLYKKQP
jgi:hypothetical protein